MNKSKALSHQKDILPLLHKRGHPLIHCARDRQIS